MVHRPALVVFFVFILNLSMISPAWSGTTTHTATYSYSMGDSETREQARQRCLAGAKRRILEQAGTHVSSKTVIENYELTSDEIEQLAVGIIQVKVVDEKVELAGDNLVITMTVTSEIDPDEVRISLEKAVEDAKNKSDDDTEQQRRIADLERRLAEVEAASAAPAQSPRSSGLDVPLPQPGKVDSLPAGSGPRNPGVRLNRVEQAVAAMAPRKAARNLERLPPARAAVILVSMTPYKRRQVWKYLPGHTRAAVTRAAQPMRRNTPSAKILAPASRDTVKDARRDIEIELARIERLKHKTGDGPARSRLDAREKRLNELLVKTKRAERRLKPKQ